MVQEQVEFEGSFGLTKLRPIKDRDTEINDGSVQTVQFVLEAKFVSIWDFSLGLLEQLKKERLKDLLRAF